MRKRLFGLADRMAMQTFVLLLGYWRWRTGRPAIVTVMAPELAQARWGAEQVH